MTMLVVVSMNMLSQCFSTEVIVKVLQLLLHVVPDMPAVMCTSCY